MKLRKKLSWLIFLFVLTLYGCATGQSKHETEQQDTVCVTRTGKKYHECSCRYLHSSSISIVLKDAIAKGYTACSVCGPPTAATSMEEEETAIEKEEVIKKNETAPAVKPPPKTSTTSKQCAAYTKSGLRCKRTTTNASGKCWQHE